jgi:hypothetical protein
VTTAPTLLDALCEELGTDSLTEREAWRVGDMSSTAHRVLEAWSRWAEAAVIPDLQSDELRPLVEPRLVPTRWAETRMPGDLSGTLGWLGLGDDSVGSAVSLVRHHLLYCHSVGLRDPFWGGSRLAVPEGMRLLMQLEPLIRAGVVVVFPSWRTRPVPGKLDAVGRLLGEDRARDAGLRMTLPANWKEFYEADLNPPDRRPPDPGPFRIAAQREELHDVLARVIDSIYDLQDYRDRADLYLPTHNALWAMKLLIEHTDLSLSREAGRRKLQLLPELLKTSLPGFADRLTVADIIAIRSDDSFAEWRRILGSALTQVGDLNPEDLVVGSPALAHLNAQLDVAAQGARAQVERSRALRDSKRAAIEISVPTALAAASALATGANPVGAAAVGVGVTAKLMLDWWQGRESKGKQALMRHAVLFQQELGIGR